MAMSVVLFGTLVGVAPRAGRIVAQAPEALSKVYRRAEFWDPEQATLGDIVNVVGRWKQAEEWQTRTQFETVENQRDETEYQAATKERYEMAQRMGCVERIAMRQNVRTLPFVDEKLAAAYGMTCADFEAMPVSREAINIVYDALAESKSGLIPPAVVNQRRSEWLTPEGGLDEGRFSQGLYKSRSLVIVSWFFLGKGQILGAVVGLKIIADTTNFWEKYSLPPGFEYLILLAGFAAAWQATSAALDAPKIEEY